MGKKDGNGWLIIGVIALIIIIANSEPPVEEQSIWSWISHHFSSEKKETNNPAETSLASSPQISNTACQKEDYLELYEKEQEYSAWLKERNIQLQNEKEDGFFQLQTAYRCGMYEEYVTPTCPSNAVRIGIAAATGSMRPTFSAYDELWGFKPTYLRQPKLCDVVTYQLPETRTMRLSNGQLLSYDRQTHRIIDVNATTNRFITKGDATWLVDDYQPAKSDVLYIICEQR